MKGKIFKIIFPVLGCITGLLFVWVVVGNFVATQQEKKVKADIEKLLKRYPYTAAYNDSVLKLHFVAGDLFNIPSTPDFPMGLYLSFHVDFRKEANFWKDENLRDNLREYLSQQIRNGTDSVTTPPKELQTYSNSNINAMDVVQDYILKNEVPQFEAYPVFRLDIGLPSMLGIVSFQRIFYFHALEELRQGDSEEAYNFLEASWKINRSLQKHPILLSQLVNLTSVREMIGVARKFDTLPREWVQELSSYNHHVSILDSIEMEERILSFHLIGDILNFSDEYFNDLYIEGAERPVKSVLRILRFFKPIVNPYMKLSAVDYYWKSKQAYESFREQIIKLQESEELCQEKLSWEPESAWWNAPANLAVEVDPVLQLSKVSRYVLDIELTQKILYIKELAAKEGKWPQLPETMKSSICSDIEWVYQVTDEGTMSISLKETPEWLKERLEKSDSLPMHYTDSTIPERSVAQ